MADLGALIVHLQADTAGFTKGLNEAQGGLGKFGTLAKAGMAAVGVAAVAGAAVATKALVNVGREGLEAFQTFQKGMNEVFTLLPGISQEAMGAMTEDVKAFSKEFGVLPEKTIPALYQAISAGVPADNVFAFLETAHKAASAGVTDLTVAVDGISSVINAYGADVLSATEASDKMFTAVRLGKTTFEELASSLFNVVPVAAALGVNFGDVTAALATMTAQGVPTNVATTQLRQLFIELSKAGSQVAATFTEIAGKSFKDFIAAGGNTNEALALLTEYAKEAGLNVNDLFGSVEAGNAALALTGEKAATFARNIEEMGRSAGATEEAYARMEESLSRTMDRIKANFDVMKISIGEKLAPVFERFSQWLLSNMPTIERVLVGTFGVIVDVLEDAWGTVEGLIGAFKMLFTADEGLKGFQAVFENFGQSGITVVTYLRDGWREFIEFMGQVKDIIAPIFGELIETIRPIMSDLLGVFASGWGDISDRTGSIWDGIKTIILGVLQIIRDAVVPFLQDVQAWWATHGEQVVATVQWAWNLIQTTIQGSMAAIQLVIGTILALIQGDFSTAWANIQTIASVAWNTLKTLIEGIMGALADAVDAKVGEIGQNVADGWQNIVDVSKVLWDTLKSVIAATLNDLPGVVSRALGGIVGAVTGPLQSAYNAAVAWVQKIRSAISGISPVVRWSPAPVEIIDQGLENMRKRAAGHLQALAEQTRSQVVVIRGELSGLGADTFTAGTFAARHSSDGDASTGGHAGSSQRTGTWAVTINIYGQGQSAGEAAADAFLKRCVTAGVAL